MSRAPDFFRPVSAYPGDAALSALLAACRVKLSAAEIRNLADESIEGRRSPAELVRQVVADMDPRRVCETDAEKLVNAILALWNEMAGARNRSMLH